MSDSLLGSAWPSMYPGFGVPMSYAGFISMTISAGTVTAALLSDRIARKIGSGKVAAGSVALAALCVLGFSLAPSYIFMILWAFPYGFTVGSIDPVFNNYIALHYDSKYMSWLHGMWGIGAAIGPHIMGAALTGGLPWNAGYRRIFFVQLVMAVVLFLSLPMWKGRTAESSADSSKQSKPLTLRQFFKLPGALAAVLSFFCYCAVEQTAGLWAGSYLTLNRGISPDAAASFASMFFIGIAAGRILSGFITMKLNDVQMVHLGSTVIAVGIALMFIPGSSALALISFVLIGLGCAPIFPCMMHATPVHFGEENSPAVVGVQMAGAYLGILSMPPLFGLIANNISVGLMPVFLLVMLIIMVFAHRKISKQKF